MEKVSPLLPTGANHDLNVTSMGEYGEIVLWLVYRTTMVRAARRRTVSTMGMARHDGGSALRRCGTIEHLRLGNHISVVVINQL